MKEEFSELKATRPDLEIAFRKCVDRFRPQLDELSEIVKEERLTQAASADDPAASRLTSAELGRNAVTE